MKISKLFALLLVVASIFAFSACEEETITVKNTDGDAQAENGDAD